MNRHLRTTALCALAFAAALGATAARANFNITVGAGPTALYAIDAGNGGTGTCATANVECMAHVVVGTDGNNVIGNVNDPATAVVGNSLVAAVRQLVTVAGQLGSVQGAGASGASVTGNPLQGGGRAQSNEATAVSDGQIVEAAFGLTGKQITVPFSDKENWVKGAITSAMTGTSSTQLIAAVASKKLYVTHVSCTDSNGTATNVLVQDGNGGATLMTLAAGATYGGQSATGTTPLTWTTSGNALYAQNVTTSASVTCNAAGFSGT